LVREQSLQKESTLKMKSKGVEIVVGDVSQPEKLDLSHVDILVSTIHFTQLLEQIPLVKHAKSFGIKRFVPCDFGTAADPEGEMVLREVKEKVRQAVREAQIPYTFIDVGWWFQLALPKENMFENRYGNGDVTTALTDLRDIGKFVAKILLDDRTIGNYVFIWGEELSQNEIEKIANKYSKKEVKWTKQISTEEVKKRINELRNDRIAKKGGIANSNLSDSDVELLVLEYEYNKYIYGHNTVKHAKEFYGALDARELYPDVKPNSFDNFVKEHFAQVEKE